MCNQWWVGAHLFLFLLQILFLATKRIYYAMDTEPNASTMSAPTAIPVSPGASATNAPTSLLSSSPTEKTPSKQKGILQCLQLILQSD